MIELSLIDNGSHPVPIEVSIVLASIILGIMIYVLASIYIRKRGGKAK